MGAEESHIEESQVPGFNPAVEDRRKRAEAKRAAVIKEERGVSYRMPNFVSFCLC